MTKLTFEVSKQNQSEDFFARLCSTPNSEVEIKFVSKEESDDSKIQMKIGSMIVLGHHGASLSFRIDDQHKIIPISATGSLEIHEEITDLFSTFSEHYDHHDITNLYCNYSDYDE